MTISTQWYPDVKYGNVFIGSTAAAGVAAPISTGTAVTFGIWNNSTDTDAVLLELTAGYMSGTIVVATLGLANQNVGFSYGATGNPMTAFTAGTPKNAYLGSGKASAMAFTPSAATLTTGGTACYWSGYNFANTTAANGISVARIPIDGRVVATPGQLVFVCWSAAQTGVMDYSLMWAEVKR